MSAEYVSGETCGHNKLCPYKGCVQLAFNFKNKVMPSNRFSDEPQVTAFRLAICRLLACNLPSFARWFTANWQGVDSQAVTDTPQARPETPSLSLTSALAPRPGRGVWRRVGAQEGWGAAAPGCGGKS